MSGFQVESDAYQGCGCSHTTVNCTYDGALMAIFGDGNYSPVASRFVLRLRKELSKIRVFTLVKRRGGRAREAAA